MMNIRRLTVLLMMICVCAGSAAAQSMHKQAKADSLFTNHKEEQALDAYNAILQKEPDNMHALWHSSLLYARIGHRYDNKDREKKYYAKALERAKHALKVDSTDTHANFAMAVAMGRQALIASTKKRVAASRAIKKYAERSLQADSANAGAWHILGRWNYEISNLNFIEKLAANALFGGIPKGASSKKAVKDIKKAISLNPDLIIYYRDLANAYKDLGEKKQAIATCLQGLQKPAATPEDKMMKKDCQKIIHDLQ